MKAHLQLQRNTNTGTTEAIEGMVFLIAGKWLFVPAKRQDFVLEKAHDVRTKTDENVGYSTSEGRQDDSGWPVLQN